MARHRGRETASPPAVQITTQLEELNALLGELLSGDEARAEAAIGLLAATGDAGSAALLRALRSGDVDNRWWAVRALAVFEDAKTEWFLPALADPVAAVRAAGCLALASHPDAAAIPGLVSALKDEDSLAAVMAVHALIKIGRECVPALLNAFEGAPPRGQIQILRVLADLRDQRSIPLMLSAQGGDSAAQQYWAQEGLERLGLNMVYLSPD